MLSEIRLNVVPVPLVANIDNYVSNKYIIISWITSWTSAVRFGFRVGHLSNKSTHAWFVTLTVQPIAIHRKHSWAMPWRIIKTYKGILVSLLQTAARPAQHFFSAACLSQCVSPSSSTMVVNSTGSELMWGPGFIGEPSYAAGLRFHLADFKFQRIYHSYSVWTCTVQSLLLSVDL